MMMKHFGDIIASFVGGGFMVILAMPMEKAIEVVFMALLGGVIGAFAKGAGASMWEWTKRKFTKKDQD